MNMYNKNYNTLYTLALMSVIVPIAGELNIYPFNDSFRISFGMPTFFFFLLLCRKNNSILSSIVVGSAVVTFRILIDVPIADFADSFIRHYPTFFYYLSFGILFYVTRIKHIIHLPLLVGFIGVFLDFIASSAELAVQYIAFDSHTNFENLQNISFIAIFRSYFTVGAYSLITLHNTRIKKDQVQQQNEKLIMLITDLYEETTNLKKLCSIAKV